MARLFQNPTLHNEFEEKGYVQLSLLNAQQVDHLLDVYHQFMGEEKETREGKEHLYESSRTHDLDWNLRMNEAIRNAFVDPVKPHFENYTLFGGTFMLKAPKKSTVLPLHQDWSVVDEDQYQSLFIWCPLVDIHPQNGGLFVLPGSHNYFKNYRSGSMQSQRIQPEGRIKKHIVDIVLSAGQALIYSDRLFHGSYANTTEGHRTVATARINEQNAELVYYHKQNNDQVDVVKASPKFYLQDANRLDRGERPDGYQTLRSISYRYRPITEHDLIEKLEPNTISGNNGRSLYKEKNLEEQFEKDGYLVLPFLEPDEIERLKKI